MIYVDDIIVIENDEKEKQALREWLIMKFKIKELVRLKYFLGIEVEAYICLIRPLWKYKALVFYSDYNIEEMAGVKALEVVLMVVKE